MSRKRSSQVTSGALPRVSRVQSIVFTIAAAISLIGLADATYLAVQAITGQSVVCGGSASCSEVLGSAYARIGGVPVAAFGVVAYFSAFAFATFAAFGSGQARRLFAMIVWLMFAGTLWFLYLQTFVLHAYCRYCLFSAAMSFLLAGLVIASPPPNVKSLR